MLRTMSEVDEFLLVMQAALTLDEVLSAYVSHVRRVIEADSLAVYVLGDDGRLAAVHSRADSRLLQDYESFGRCDDPLFALSRKRRAAVESCHCSAWVESGAALSLNRHGMHHALVAPLRVGGTLRGSINFARTYDRGCFGDAELERVELVASHVSLAVARALRLETPERRARVTAGTFEALSPREAQIARLVGDGRTNSQIAAVLFLSENTVRQHLKNAYAKTKVHNRAELVRVMWSHPVEAVGMP